jgi:glucuronokinase
MMIESKAYARAGLLGNPSDGYFGKTIAIIVKNFEAKITLCETSELVIEAMASDRNRFCSISHFLDVIRQNGYYGGQRIVKAVIKRFCDYCEENCIAIANKNFTIRYESSIPRQVGLAGSSAIAAATLRALMKFYGVDIPKIIQPTLILQAETRELGINAGLQDRVIQIYEGCVYMDFEQKYLHKNGYGRYEPLDTSLLPKLYIAYKTDLSKVSGDVFNNLKERFDKGDAETHQIIGALAENAEHGRTALFDQDYERLNYLINRNFDLRCKIMNISDSNMEFIRVARESGASAKFSGSGGAIIGMYPNEDVFNKLTINLKKIGADVVKPCII